MKKLFFIFYLSNILIINAQTGIGTTTPVNKLQIETSAAAPATSGTASNGNIRLGVAGANQVLDLGLGNTFGWLQARDRTNYTTNNNLAINPNGGNVGIGTISPLDRLVIGSTVAIHDGGHKVIGLGYGIGNGALVTGFPAEIRLDPAIGLLSFGTTATSTALGASPIITQRMAITSNGNVGIGTSSPATNLHIENGNVFGGNPSSTNSPSLYIYNNNATSNTANATALIRTNSTNGGKPYLSLDVANNFGYSIGVNNPSDQMILNTTWNFTTSTSANNAIIINRTGISRVIIPASNGSYVTDWPSGWGGGFQTFDISAASIYANGYVTRSDRRLKNSIQTIKDDVVSKFLKLKPVSYYWNQDKPRDSKLQYGFIAQETEEIFPELVSTATDEMQTKSINYQNLHAISIKVIQAQQKQIDELIQNQKKMLKEIQKLKAQQKKK